MQFSERIWNDHLEFSPPYEGEIKRGWRFSTSLLSPLSQGGGFWTGPSGGKMKWITREKVKVDRVACPWLIRRFIDREAEFLFVPAEQVLSIAEHERAIPYDFPGVTLGHHNGKCSFEAIVSEYRIDDPAIELLSKIVHGADVSHDLYGLPEAAGLKAIAVGFSLLNFTDHQILEKESVVYDALYEYCKWKLNREEKS